MFLQLARTTPYLSGQCKLDICLIRGKDGVTTSDCHLSPIADSLPYTDSIQRPFFNYTYNENLKFLFSHLQDNFFRDFKSIRDNKILYKKDAWVQDTEMDYMCGLKRLRYSKYNKQLALFCPIWIESAEDLNDLYFEFEILGENSTIANSIIPVKLSEELTLSLKEYLKGVSSDLLTIDFDREYARIIGVDPSTGTVLDKDISLIVKDLLERERPMLEMNSTLCQLFGANSLIARQLLNLNFCFNMDDLFPINIVEKMYNLRWNVKCNVILRSEKVPMKDFFSNYSKIDSIVVKDGVPNYDSEYNVFSYLDDDKCIDYMYVDKTTQPDVYWSLAENPNYIYNLYNGFSPFYIDSKDNVKQTQGLMLSYADAIHEFYKDEYNNISWAEVVDFRGYSDYKGKLIDYVSSNTESRTIIDAKPNSVTWMNGAKFDLTGQSFSFQMRVIIVLISDSVSQYDVEVTCKDNGNTIYDKDGYKTLVVYVKNLQQAKDKITMYNMVKGKAKVTGDGISEFYNLMKVFSFYVYPTKVCFSKSVVQATADSPKQGSNEVTYFAQDYNVNSFVYRYSGNLRPFFIDTNDEHLYNIDYYYKSFDKSTLYSQEILEYNKYLNTKYLPNYPSLGYYALKDNGRIDVNSTPLRFRNDLHEYSWYNNSYIYVLKEGVRNAFTSNLDEQVTDGKIKSFLLDAINICPSVFDDQVWKLYKFSLDYDYVSKTNIRQQIFRIKYNLQ